MRICIIGDEPSVEDEGMRILSGRLASEMTTRHDVLYLRPIDVVKRRSLRGLKTLSPDIVHYFPGPTALSFLILKSITKVAHSVGIASATHPHLNPRLARAIRFSWPDLVVCQSRKTMKLFSDIGIKTEILRSGVDLEKFTPGSPKERERLRDTYGIKRDEFVVLHVGHLNGRRNLRQLGDLQQKCNVQVVIVVSSSTTHDATLEKELVDSGCIVMKEYLPRIEDLYRLSDCYVFPTCDPRGSIEFPLSVLEALACNLPVVSSRFGSLPEAFTAGNGVYFYDSPDDLKHRIEEVMHGNRNYETRELVLDFSWSEVAKNLEGIYTRALE